MDTSFLVCLSLLLGASFSGVVSLVVGMHVVCVVSQALLILALRTHLWVGCVCLGLHTCGVWCRMCSWHREPIFECVVSVLGCTHVVCVVSHALLASRTHLWVGCACRGLHMWCACCRMRSWHWESIFEWVVCLEWHACGVWCRMCSWHREPSHGLHSWCVWCRMLSCYR